MTTKPLQHGFRTFREMGSQFWWIGVTPSVNSRILHLASHISHPASRYKTLPSTIEHLERHPLVTSTPDMLPYWFAKSALQRSSRIGWRITIAPSVSCQFFVLSLSPLCCCRAQELQTKMTKTSRSVDLHFPNSTSPCVLLFLVDSCRDLS